MNLRNSLLSILLFLFHMSLNAQRGGIISQECPPSFEEARKTVEIFLTWDYLDSKRVQSGTNGIQITQIRPVETTSTCNELNFIISNNQKYQSIQSSLSSGQTKYFYRTDEFYFIFWDDKPEELPDGAVRIKTGPKRIFIVVSGDFQNTWEFYI